jgi:hypothetical protein
MLIYLNNSFCFTINLTQSMRKNLFQNLLILILLLSSLGCQPKFATPSPATPTPNPGVSILSQRTYTVHQQVALINEGQGKPEKQNIWVALISDFPPYQQVLSMDITPEKYQLVVDEYGNHYAEFDFSGQPAGSTRLVKIDYQIVVNELIYKLEPCLGELPNEFTQPELHIESANPQVISLAGQLSQGTTTPCQQVRAFYDYIGDHLIYTANGENWGAQATLGLMGSDCTEYASLLAALSRAQGIPARYFEGLLYLDTFTGSLAKVEHAWPDVYLPGIGWMALDPTLGRKPANRATYFAHYTPDHIIVILGASPSVLRGSSYWTHLYWPGDSTHIRVEGNWNIEIQDPISH